jgi:hypothetical protein
MFNKYFKKLSEGRKETLPLTLKYLNAMSDSRQGAYNYDSLSLIVQTLGHVYTKLEINNKVPYNDFNSLLNDNSVLNLNNNQFTFFLNNSVERVDQTLVINIVYANPGNENFSHYSTSVCKTIQDGCRTVTEEIWEQQPPIKKEVTVTQRDTTYRKEILVEQPPIKKIITKQVPNYITVSATIHEEMLEKRASAMAEYFIYDENNQLIKSGHLNADCIDSDRNKFYTGDSRAFDGFIPCTSSTLSVASDRQMIEKMRYAIQREIFQFMRNQAKVESLVRN